jgi:hypothetical protein
MLFFEIAKDLVAPFDIPTIIRDAASYKKAIPELRGLGNSAEKIKAAQRLNLLELACKNLQADLDIVGTQLTTFSGDYNALATERENVNKLRLSDFLVRGKTVIDDVAFIEDECPFCLSPYKLEELQAEVGRRTVALGELQAKLDVCAKLKETLLSAITDAGTKAKAIATDYTDLADFNGLVEDAKIAQLSLRECYQAVKTAFDTLVVFTPPESFDGAIAELSGKCGASATTAHEAAMKLELTEIEKQIAEVLTTLQSLGGQVKSYEKCQRTITAFEEQILTLSAVFEEFVSVLMSAHSIRNSIRKRALTKFAWRWSGKKGLSSNTPSTANRPSRRGSILVKVISTVWASCSFLQTLAFSTNKHAFLCWMISSQALIPITGGGFCGCSKRNLQTGR